ncbi:hypothetical protein SUNI508_01384 [Seiridium unicorne]|uniref:Secreted protein n=1 Tax=Seiridium unicorne TaxID=138068 RepID=A0ABR2USY2_9PEZI
MPAFKKVFMLFAASLFLVQIAFDSMIHLFALGGGIHSPCSERLYYDSFSLDQYYEQCRGFMGYFFVLAQLSLPICGNRDCTNVESMQLQYISAYESEDL